MSNIKNKLSSDWNDKIAIIIGLSLVSVAIITSSVWVEKSYTIDCSLMDKLNSDGWFMQFFEIDHKASIKSMIQRGDIDNSCDIVLDATIMTHIILVFRGLN